MNTSEKLEKIISKYNLNKNMLQVTYKQDCSIIHIIWFVTISIGNIKSHGQSINKIYAENIAVNNLLSKLEKNSHKEYTNKENVLLM